MIETVVTIIISTIVSSVVTTVVIKIKSKQHTGGSSEVTQQQKADKADELCFYQKQAKETSELRKFRHDYKNQLAGLQILIESQEYDRAKAYLQEITGNFSSACEKHKTYSDNPLIDAILQNLAYKCEKANISFDACVMVQDKLPLSDADVCTVFYNLADNAYEAVVRTNINKNEKRFISLTSSMRAKWLIITVENSYDGISYTDSDGNYLTRKDNDNNLHGIGLNSIDSLISKVNGAQIRIQPDTENKVFSVSLIFPL